MEQDTTPSKTTAKATAALQDRIGQLEVALEELIAYAKTASGSTHTIPVETDPVWRAQRLLG